jgi:predicted esterase
MKSKKQNVRRGYILTVFIIYLLFSLGLLASGCTKEDALVEPTPAEQESSYLVSAKLIGTYSTEEVKGRYKSLPQVGQLTRYPVKVYAVVYNTTDPEGKPLQASGAMLIPDTKEPMPVLSQQHGTITVDASAPSHYNSNSEVWSFGTVLASAGHIISAPDYIGYGKSMHLPHPYEHAPTLASASLDMLRAVKEYCKQNSINTNNKLFLTGYSEGGYATMALHKLIEEKHSDEFTVTASAPGAGAYDKAAFAEHILQSNKPLSFINSYLWVLKTYNDVYSINRPFTYYLNEPYATRVAESGVHADVNKNPQELFTSTFRQGVLTKEDTDMLSAFKDNSIYDWKPTAPVALFHGTADDFVPFFNSQHAFDAMQARGAYQVELREIEGGNHFTSIPNFTVGAFLFFQDYR